MKRYFPILIVFSISMMAVLQALTLNEIGFKDAQNKERTLKDFSGKVILIVNVASECGLTKQYDALEKLYRDYKDQGFTILAFPCNDFANQEPGTIEEIMQFCKTNYQVTFPIMGKVSVKGSSQHALYRELTHESSPFPGKVSWNFGKFLINRQGQLVARFNPRTTPDSEEVITAIRREINIDSKSE